MGARDGAHRVRRRVVVQKNAAAAVDLQVDEARRQQRAGRHRFYGHFGINLAARGNALNQALTDQDGCIVVPSRSVEDSVGRNGGAPSLRWSG